MTGKNNIMLTIKNTHKLKDKYFSFKGKDWLVYGIDEQVNHYRFIFMYKVDGIWSIQSTQYVYISREPLTMTKGSYRIYSGCGDSYIYIEDIQDMWNIITKICKEDLIK